MRNSIALTFTDSGQELALGMFSQGILADVNGDGYADLITALLGANEVWLNDGAGTFTNSFQTLDSNPTNTVAAADVDGDGDLDLAFGNSSAGISIWTNNGSGIFTDSGQSLGSGDTFQIVFIDIDQDNDLDIVDGRTASPSAVFLNDGSGTFSVSATTIDTDFAYGMLALDWNRDGITDLAVSNSTEVNIYYGDGDGDFDATVDTLNNAVYSICAHDFDADSIDDLAAMGIGGDNALFQTYTFPFQYFMDKSQNFGAVNSTNCTAADMDNDGYVDIVQAPYMGGDDTTHIWLNAGSFSFATSTADFLSGPAGVLGATDVDGDGDADLLLAVGASTGTIYLNDTADGGGGNNPNTAPPAPTLTAVGTPDSRSPLLEWAHPSDDHDPSYVLTYNVRMGTGSGQYDTYSGIRGVGPGHVRNDEFQIFDLSDDTYYWSVQAVDSAGAKSAWSTEDSFELAMGFDAQENNITISSADETGEIIPADFDGDGDIDIMVATSESSSRKLYLNDGSGSLSVKSAAFTFDLAQAADVDGDGDLDLLGNNSVWLNNGSAALSLSTLQAPAFTGKFCVADLDGDGDVDGMGAGSERVYLNNGAGAFAPSGQAAFGDCVQIACGDFDGDADVDAAVLVCDDTTAEIWKNDGKGNFGSAAAQSVSLAESWDAVTAADVDGDGDLDIIPSNGSYLINNSGTFSQSGTNLSPGTALNIALGDVDNDGDLDAFSASYPGLSSIMWRNDGSGSFSYFTETFYSATSYPRGVAMVDLNGDNYLDVITTSGITYFNDLHDGPGGSASANTPPNVTTVSDLDAYATSTVTLTWNQATDAETPAEMLTYNLRVGTTSGGSEIFAGAAPLGPGNAGAVESRTLNHLPNGAIYWSVQTVDSAYATSTWSAEDTFTVAVTFSMEEDATTIGTAQTKAVYTGDFNGDGYPDLAEALNGANQIWLNDGAGGYTNSQSLGTADSRAVTGGDIDGDGDLDLIFANGGANNVWLNNGSGAFSSGPTVGNSNTQCVAAADFDYDGDVDIVEGNVGESKLWLNSGGAFSVSASLGAYSTYDIVPADFDADGDVDMILINDGANKALFNVGDGTFNTSSQNLGSNISESGAAADLDGDGDIDYVEGTSSANLIWMNNGAGVFTQSAAALGSDYTAALITADLDNDGDTDIFEANTSALARLWLNDGTGAFSQQGTYGGTSTTGAAPADVDGDSDLDIILGVDGGGDIVLLNKIADAAGGNSPNTAPSAPAVNAVGNPSLTTITLTWNPGTDVETPLHQLTYNVRLGSTSGGNDIISQAVGIGPGNSGATPMATFRNVYPGTYYWSVQTVDDAFKKSAWSTEDVFNNIVPFADSQQTLGSAKTRGILSEDVDGDGDYDVIAGNDGASTLWLNNGSGVFTDSGQTLGSDATMAVFGADVDMDGDLDLVTGDYSGAAYILLNSGGTFTDSGQTLDMSGLNIFSVTGVDVENDGDTDLVFATFNGNDKIWLNNGSGVFSTSTYDISETQSYWVESADVNGDSFTDLLVATTAGVSVWMNDGSGTGSFSYHGITFGNTNSRVVAAVDLNADGYPDAVSAAGKYIYVDTNTGSGSFITTAQTLANSMSVSSLQAVDVDLDGDMDIVAGTSDGATVWLNDGSGILTDSQQVLGPADTRALTLADFDGDSDPDLFSGNYNESNGYYTNWRISSGSPISANTAPSAPTLNSVLNPLDGQPVVLTWSGATDAESTSELLRYNVKVGTTSGGHDAFSGAAQQGRTTTGAITGTVLYLATGTYYWSVQTVDTAQMTSSWSSEGSFTISEPDTTPPTFSGLQGANDTGAGGTVTLLWSAASDPSTPITYNVYYTLASESFDFGTPNISTTSVGCTATGLTDDAPYLFIVRAEDSQGNEDTNNVQLAETPTTAATQTITPNAPTALAASTTETTADLSWTAPTQNTNGSSLTDLAGYNMYRGSACYGTDTARLNSSLIDDAATSYQDDTIATGNVYYYYITAVNDSAVESASSTCAMASFVSKGASGAITQLDMSGGVQTEGYPEVGVSGLTVKLMQGETEIGSSVTGEDGSFLIPVSGDTTGKSYSLRLVVTEESGYFADVGSCSGGICYRTLVEDITIGDTVEEITVPMIGLGPAVGDANCDGLVDVQDFLMFKVCFGANQGEEEYTQDCDFDGTGAVDVMDFLILKKGFGGNGSPVTPTPCVDD